MASVTTVPVTVTPDAAARIADLGMQSEFEQMVEHARQVVPYLRSIRVTLEHDPEGEDEPGIVIWSHREDTDWEKDTSDWDNSRWKVTTFPPEVCIQFSMITLYNDEADYGG